MTILRMASIANLLVLAGTNPVDTMHAQDGEIPIYVRAAITDSSPHVGSPLFIRVTIENRLSLPVSWSTYSLTPNAWNGESLNVNLLESQRLGTSGGLFLASPRLEPPLTISGPASHTIAPGKTLTTTIALGKWQIVEGWRAGAYRVVLEVRNVRVGDGRVRLSIASDTVPFTIAR